MFVPHSEIDLKKMFEELSISSLDDLFTPIPETLKLNDGFGIFSVEQSFTIKTVNSPSNMVILLSILFNNLKSDCQSL